MKAIFYTFGVVSLIALSWLGASAALRTDGGIESSIKRSFIFRHYLKDDEIQVRSMNGAVTLKGRVSTEYHKNLAYETAAAQRGVNTIDNQLKVDASAPAIASDAWLTGKVKTVLLFHRSVSAANTQVSCNNGIVTLRGTAENQAQKELTADYARDVVGVKDVHNQISISNRPGEESKLEGEIDDASITAEVKLALLFHRSTSALNTRVETNNGVVILRGTAKNAAEKDLDERIVSDVRGVKRVENRIAVD